MKTKSQNCLMYFLAAILVLPLFSSTPLKAQQPAQASASPAPEKKAQQLESIKLRNTVEDFSVITLDKSKLTPETPIATMEDHEKFTRERIQVQWRDVDPFDLYVMKPKGVEKPPVIIYLYGFPAGPDAYKNDRWVERVTSGGFAAVGFVGALTGDRFQMRPMQQTFISELQESLGTTVHDVQMVLNYLELRKDLDMHNIGILGNGSGATVAILAAAADQRIKAIDLMEPWGDWPDWIANTINMSKHEHELYSNDEFLKKVAPLDPVKWLPQLKSQKVLLQFVDTDDELTKSAKAKMEAAAAKTIEVIHYEDRVKLMSVSRDGRRFEWIKNQLRPPAPASTAQTPSKK